MLDVEALSEMMAGIISEEVEKAVAPLNARIAELESRPAGPQMDDVKGVVEIMISDAFVVKGARLIKTPELPDFAPMIEDAVGKAFASLPAPEKGKDAAGIVEALKDSGELVLTLSDGRLIRTGIRDGEKGQDGRDGFGFEDLDFEYDGERSMALTFTKAEEFKTFRFDVPMMIDRGVYKAGETYQRGDTVTWGGSSWTAQKETDAKPDTAESGWRLAVKKGRDGKDAKNG